MNNPPICIIGAGGIGSFFCDYLARDIEQDQLPGVTKDSVVVYDFDVVEEKNLRHQNYSMFDVSAPKAYVMTERYGFKAKASRFGTRDLTKHREFIICADNPGVRKLVYEHCKTFSKPFVDMRTEGDMIALFTHREDLKTLLSSLGKEKESIEGRSCQRAGDVAQNITQHGNYVVAAMGIQCYLDIKRENPVFKSYIGQVNKQPNISF